MELAQWLSSKEFACNVGAVGDMDLIPGSGRSPREENGNPLQYSCLGNHMDRAWRLQSVGSQKQPPIILYHMPLLPTEGLFG